MHPILCRLGPFTIYTYGLMLAVAVLVCSFLMQREARARGLDEQRITDLVFWVVIAGIIGSRIFFVILNLPFFWKNPLEIVMIHHGGLAWQGGLIAGLACGVRYIRRHRLPMGVVADLAAPYIALGQAVGRIGCFFNGCCYGRPVSWGLYFPVLGARLHPTQLYSSAALLAVFVALKLATPRLRAPGQVLALYLILASLQRFFIEFLRGDHDTLWAGLSVFQWVSLGGMAAGGLLYEWSARRREGHGDPKPSR